MAAMAAQPISIARWIPSLPAMLMNPFGGDADNSKSSHDSRDDDSAVHSNVIAREQGNGETRPAMRSTFSFADSEPSPSPSRTSRSSFFAEPETTYSLSAGSREGSIDGKRLGKSRPKTQFSVCHAPPESRTRQRLHRRPRSLLQLHRLRGAARPVPAFEVIPSTNFSLTLNAAVTRVFKTKHGLCPSDLVVLKAEKYSVPSDEEDEDKEVRDVIGLICKGRKDDDKLGGGRAKIVMADGKVWEAYPINNGGYEFHSVDKNGLGLTVRWVPKRNKDGTNVGKDGLKRFNFSTISPNTRRHPVIASLSKTAMDINDTYKLPDVTSTTTPLGTPKLTSTILEDAMDDENDRLETDSHLRELITITSIFVTFKEGWSPSFKYEDKDTCKFGPHSPTKSITNPIISPPGSPALIPRNYPLEKRASIKSISSGIIRRTSLINKSNRNSVISNSDDEYHTSPSRSNSVAKAGRARADSSSTVLVHRAASNRRKNNQQWRPDLLGTQLTVQENSKEDLGRVSSSKSRSMHTPSPLAGAVRQGKPAATKSRHSSVDKKEEYHRGSDTTMASVLGSPTEQTTKKSRKSKKLSRWRGLFCGSRDGD